ncbi:MAG: PAS domain S-box protein [Halodesulfurarchaeum sp.]
MNDASEADDTTRLPAEQRYRTLFHALPGAVFVLDPETGSVLEVNERATDLFGYDRGELLGMGIEDVSSGGRFPSNTRPSELVREVAPGESRTEEWKATDSEGTEFWVEAALRSVRMGGDTRVIVSLRGNEDRTAGTDCRAFRSAVENAGHSIYWTDADGVIEYANPAFEEITGYDREAVVGSTPRIFKSGEMSEAYYEELWETITDGEVFEHEVVNEDADGERFVINQTIAPITDDSGDIVRYVAVNTEITDRRRREQRLEEERENAPGGSSSGCRSSTGSSGTTSARRSTSSRGTPN